jgi:hypothetical protein
MPTTEVTLLVFTANAILLRLPLVHISHQRYVDLFCAIKAQYRANGYDPRYRLDMHFGDVIYEPITWQNYRIAKNYPSFYSCLDMRQLERDCIQEE